MRDFLLGIDPGVRTGLAARLEDLTGWTHPTCQHARDAARLVVGESVHTVRRRLAGHGVDVTAGRQPATVS
ncbi:MAG: hypothetical protein AAFX41_05220 [Bacteroidota bacterium]